MDIETVIVEKHLLAAQIVFEKHNALSADIQFNKFVQAGLGHYIYSAEIRLSRIPCAFLAFLTFSPVNDLAHVSST